MKIAEHISISAPLRGPCGVRARCPLHDRPSPRRSPPPRATPGRASKRRHRSGRIGRGEGALARTEPRVVQQRRLITAIAWSGVNGRRVAAVNLRARRASRWIPVRARGRHGSRKLDPRDGPSSRPYSSCRGAARRPCPPLPRAAIRRWVPTLPYPLRYRCAYGASLTSEVLRAVTRSPSKAPMQPSDFLAPFGYDFGSPRRWPTSMQGLVLFRLPMPLLTRSASETGHRFSARPGSVEERRGPPGLLGRPLPACRGATSPTTTNTPPPDVRELREDVSPALRRALASRPGPARITTALPVPSARAGRRRRCP